MPTPTSTPRHETLRTSWNATWRSEWTRWGRSKQVKLKDHKDNFADRIPCRLINPAKLEMGKVSKQILDNINAQLKKKLEITTWKNSAAVICIDWFKAVDQKEKCAFVCFDIAELYPSISQELLMTVLSLASKHTSISDADIEVIRHSRKSLLFSGNKTLAKRENSSFDVTMGSYDGAEVCDLIGLFALATLPQRGLQRGLQRHVVEFDLSSLMHYFIARKAGDELPTDNFRCFSSDSLKLYRKIYCREPRVAFALADGGTDMFIRCFCKAEMKVSERYRIELIVKSSTSVGEVVYATCECKAGLGPKATCKHVGAV